MSLPDVPKLLGELQKSAKIPLDKLAAKIPPDQQKVIAGVAAAGAVGLGIYYYAKSRGKKTFGNYNYPVTEKGTTIDVLHGIEVPDPYRWLEDPDARATKSWVKGQNRVTDKYLADCTYKERIFKRLETMYNYEKITCPFKRGPRYFFFRNDGLQNQSVLWKKDSLDGDPTVMIDPNALDANGTSALSSYAFSEDGEKLAYGVSRNGSDWFTIYVKDVATGRDLPDKVEWVKFSGISWTHDGEGFFYSSYNKPAGLEGGKTAGTEVDASKGQMVKYHRLGTPYEEDPLVFSCPEEPDWTIGAKVTDCGKYLLIAAYPGCDPVNKVWFAELGGAVESLNAVCLVDNFDAQYSYVTNEGRDFWFLTNLDAPRYKVMKVALPNAGATPSKHKDAIKGAKQIIPQHPTDVLQDVRCVGGNRLVVCYLHDVCETLSVHEMGGKKVKEIALPGPGALSEITGKKNSPEMFYKYTGFTDPGTVFSYDVKALKGEEYRTTTVPGFDPSQFTCRQEFYESKDGTRIPMFIVQHKEAGAGGAPSPTILYGYGGFNISLTPNFSIFRLVFVEHFRGTYVIANIRGGGEYGEEWHKAGRIHNRQNCYDDFICAAEHLISKGVTTPSQLAINGGSNGGLLVAAVMLQRPELFKCVLADVGVLDMLRFHKFTIGHAWTSDFGSPDDPDEFRTIFKYSPYHNIRRGKKMPATLLTTGDHDDRVVPLHSYKFISALQDTCGGESYQDEPLMIKIETAAGHGAGKPTTKRLEEAANKFAFIARVLNCNWTP